MSDHRSEASSRSAVKTELTSAHLDCLLISRTSGLFVAAFWMQNSGTAQDRRCHPRLVRMSTAAQGWGCAVGLLYVAACYLRLAWTSCRIASDVSMLIGRVSLKMTVGCGKLRPVVAYRHRYGSRV